jgi:hypothetical protein
MPSESTTARTSSGLGVKPGAKHPVWKPNLSLERFLSLSISAIWMKWPIYSVPMRNFTVPKRSR